MTSVEVDVVTDNSRRMVVPASWPGPFGFRFIPDQLVYIEHIEVVESLFAIPPAEDVEEGAHLVTAVGCSIARRHV